ncbi:MAG: hypothetical protein JNL70_13965 [Saprospiraceae bacterium]|nr:hypothetical protein [Saprospiraceae bacterium]
MTTISNNSQSDPSLILSSTEVKRLVEVLRDTVASNAEKMLARDKLQVHWYAKFLSESYLKNQFKSVTKRFPNELDTLWENYLLYCGDAFFRSWEEMQKKIEGSKYENYSPDGLFRQIFYRKCVDIYRENKMERQYESYSDYEDYLLPFTHAFDDENFALTFGGLEKVDFFAKMELIKDNVERDRQACMQKNNCKRRCTEGVCQKFDAVIKSLNEDNYEKTDLELQHLAINEQKWHCLSYCEQNCRNIDSCLKHNLISTIKTTDKAKKISYVDAEKIYPWSAGACKTHVERYSQSLKSIYEKLKNKYLK